MKIISKYAADDGTIFDNKEDCLRYEKDHEDKKTHLIRCAEEIKAYCNENDDCEDCPFGSLTYGCDFNCLPTNWDI